MKDFIERELTHIREQNLWRSLQEGRSSSSSRIRMNGRTHLNFSTNDYLGYSTDARVCKAAREAISKLGAGGRSSRLVSGSLELHAELEDHLARFKGTEAALLFPAGFLANLSVISALLSEGDALIFDKLNHASLWDAAKLCRARVFVYEHARPESLEKILQRTRNYGKRLIVTDSLFSMDGDLAPLPELISLAKRSGVWLMIDDAHATGVLGAGGSGALEHFGRMGEAQIVMGTLSKALGSQGGFVCGPRDLIDLLVNRARPFIYTTALAPASCAAALKALALIAEEPERRARLLETCRALRGGLMRDFFEAARLLKDVPTPIIPFWTGTAARALKISGDLRKKGIFAPPIRPPTVEKNECRLRFSLSSDHSLSDVDQLLKSLAVNSRSMPPNDLIGGRESIRMTRR